MESDTSIPLIWFISQLDTYYLKKMRNFKLKQPSKKLLLIVKAYNEFLDKKSVIKLFNIHRRKFKVFIMGLQYLFKI